MHDFTTHHTLTFKNRKEKKIKKGPFLVIVFTFILLIAAGMGKIIFPNGLNIFENVKGSEKNPNIKINTADYQQVMKDINNLASSAEGTISVYLYDIKNNKEYGTHSQTVLTAASLNKIPILAVLYSLAEKNEIDLEKVIVLQEEDIQDYGTGSMRYDKPGTPYSIKTLARLMMEKSDNTAAYILGNQIVGMDKIQKMIDSWGMAQTNMDDNKTSARDMGILMTKIYKGEITSPSLTSEMLNFMEKTDSEDRLPKELPANVKIYHKTGDEVGKIHDVGIVDLPGRPYFLGVLCTDVTDEDKAKNIIADISKTVYNDMSR